ncbi:MAG TPA: class F sortase [Gaiellaceae bacterium]|nr:class F sortase [Gaiellaceae bacterium]
MGAIGRLVCGLVCACALVAVPAAFGAAPPSSKDPCIQGTADSCGTTGVGFYKTYKYGTRWFGDFKDAIPGSAHTYCIDLRFWYPGPQYKYKEITGGNLTNKDGNAVPAVNQQRIAYAIWQYGRSTDPDQAAAVMLYVHNQMGDARPGEVDPSVLSANVVSLYSKISKDAARFHGPYRLEIKLPGTLRVGSSVTATVRVLAAGGAALPNEPLTLSAQGLTGVPKQGKTDSLGVQRLTVTPSGGPLKLAASVGGLPSTLPRVFQASTGPATVNGQRLVLPSAQTIADSSTGSASKTQIQVSTTASPAKLLVGAKSQDKVTFSNAANWSGTVQVKVFGPARTDAAVVCTGVPAATTTLAGKGNGALTTTAVTLTKPGFYVYQEVVPGNGSTLGLTTPCDSPSERFEVDTQPTVKTTISAQTVAPGTAITDTVVVTGLNGEQATVAAALYGPFASRTAIVCTGTPVWTGTIAANGDGTYTTQPFTATTAGYYTYHESIAAAGFVRAAATTCADTAETTIVNGQPKIATQVSSQTAAPGKTITDKAVVTGLGALSAPVNVVLWGPFATKGEIKCTGTPFWKGSFTAKGDGTYTTVAAKLTKAGYYTYQESIADTPAYAGFTATCADTTETTIASASPTIGTQASAEVARMGSRLTDKVKIAGLGKTAAKVEVTLYGPFATRAAIGCKGAPAGTTSFTASGDGTVLSPAITIQKAGFYVFREHLVGSPLVKDVQTNCSETAEVSLVAPLIITGRGDVTHEVRRVSTSALTPTQVKVGSVNIDAPVSPVGIDLAQGILGVSSDIHRTGWWADGVQPGDKTGTVLIAGHVDSATAGAGAFFNVKSAKAGEKVEVTTSGGRTFTYKVVSVKSYLKSQLPTDVWSKQGRARLVLVTCGGPFDQQTKHYRDNIVLTAVPA